MNQGAQHGSFGILRFILAVLVVAGHLGPDHLYLTYQAVHVFFVLTGYVTCYMLVTRYLNQPRGLRIYAVQRLLRVYPLYAVVLPFCVLIAYLDSGITYAVHKSFYYVPPFESFHYFADWLHNLLPVAVTGMDGARVAPLFVVPAWMLSIQAFLWLLAPLLLLSRDARYLFLAAAVAYAAVTLSLAYQKDGHADWARLAMLGTFSGVLPFFMGMGIFFLRQRGARAMPHWAGVALLYAYIAVVTGEQSMGLEPYSSGFALALLLGVGLVYYFAGLAHEVLPLDIRKLDYLLSEIAFPLVMVHLPVAAVVALLTPDMHKIGTDAYVRFVSDWWLFMASLPFSVAAAALLAYTVERPARNWRRRLRGDAQPVAITPTYGSSR